MEHLAGYDDAALESLEEMIVGDHDQKSSPNHDDDILLDDMEDYAYGETFFEVEPNVNSVLKSLNPNCTETFLNTTLVPRELRNNPTYVIVSTHWLLPFARHLENRLSLQMTVTSLEEVTVISND